MLSKLNGFVLLALFTAPVLISCGVANPVKEGYYVAADASESKFPLVVVKVSGGKTATYRVSHILGGFGSGEEINSGSVSGISLGVEIPSGSGVSYTGFATQKGSQLRVRSIKMEGTDSSVIEESDVAKHEVLQDELLSSVSKEEAVAQFKQLVTRSGSGSFSSSQEEECNAAFGMACSDLFN